MRKIREVLRLKFDCGLSVRKIARSLGVGRSTVGDDPCPVGLGYMPNCAALA